MRHLLVEPEGMGCIINVIDTLELYIHTYNTIVCIS